VSDMAPSGIKAKFCNDHNIDYDEVCWLWQKAETAAFEEAAKVAEGQLWDDHTQGFVQDQIAAAIRAKAEEVQGE